MKKMILAWTGLLLLILAIPQVAKAELGCGGGCTGAEICAEFPNGITTEFTPGDHPAGCFSTANPPTPSPVLDGISYCTDNIFDGMESTTQCSTSTTTESLFNN
jgi:hypothetical protein